MVVAAQPLLSLCFFVRYLFRNVLSFDLLALIFANHSTNSCSDLVQLQAVNWHEVAVERLVTFAGSILSCQGLSVQNVFDLLVSFHLDWTAGSDSTLQVLDQQSFKNTSSRLYCFILQLLFLKLEAQCIVNKPIITRVSVCLQEGLHRDLGPQMESSAAARHFRYTSATQRSEH